MESRELFLLFGRATKDSKIYWLYYEMQHLFKMKLVGARIISATIGEQLRFRVSYLTTITGFPRQELSLIIVAIIL
jgi:hypothetical protein